MSGPITFCAASTTVVAWHGYGRGRALYISQIQHYCGWLVRLWVRSGPSHFTEKALLFLAATVMGEVGLITFHEDSINGVDGTATSDVGSHNISRSQHYCGWLARLWAISVHVTYHEASITVIGWHGYDRDQGPITFRGTSTTVVDWHGYGRGRAQYISQIQHYCGWLARLWASSGPLTF